LREKQLQVVVSLRSWGKAVAAEAEEEQQRRLRKSLVACSVPAAEQRCCRCRRHRIVDVEEQLEGQRMVQSVVVDGRSAGVVVPKLVVVARRHACLAAAAAGSGEGARGMGNRNARLGDAMEAVASSYLLDPLWFFASVSPHFSFYARRSLQLSVQVLTCLKDVASKSLIRP